MAKETISKTRLARGARHKSYQIWFTNEQHAEMKAAAEAAGVSMAELVRRGLINEITEQEKRTASA